MASTHSSKGQQGRGGCPRQAYSWMQTFGPLLCIYNLLSPDDIVRFKFYFETLFSFSEFTLDLAPFYKLDQGPHWAKTELVAIIYEKGQRELDEAWGNTVRPPNYLFQLGVFKTDPIQKIIEN